jgi:subtilisin-like proprotein convertase family protein
MKPTKLVSPGFVATAVAAVMPAVCPLFARLMAITPVALGIIGSSQKSSAALLVVDNYSVADVAIPDPPGGHVSSPVVISGAPSNAKILWVDVYYEIRHPYRGDLDVWVTRWVDGGWRDHYLRRRTPQNEQDDGDDFVGTTRNINDYNGLSPNDTWYLCAKDWGSLDTGYIDFFQIWLYYGVGADFRIHRVALNKTDIITPDTITASVTITNVGDLGGSCYLLASSTPDGNAWQDWNGGVRKAVDIPAGEKRDVTVDCFFGSGSQIANYGWYASHDLCPKVYILVALVSVPKYLFQESNL